MQSQRQKRNYLHPTMYLLIRVIPWDFILLWDNLHPTMYLLIRRLVIRFMIFLKFTSHYVSINSKTSFEISRMPDKFTSHYVSINSLSDNYVWWTACKFTSHYVSINSQVHLKTPLFSLHLHPTMYLLIPCTV